VCVEVVLVLQVRLEILLSPQIFAQILGWNVYYKNSLSSNNGLDILLEKS